MWAYLFILAVLALLDYMLFGWSAPRTQIRRFASVAQVALRSNSILPRKP